MKTQIQVYDWKIVKKTWGQLWGSYCTITICRMYKQALSSVHAHIELIWIQWNFDIAKLHLIKPIVLERSRVQLLEFRVTNDSNLDPHVSSVQSYKAMPNDWMNWRFKQEHHPHLDRNSRSVWGMNINLYRKFHPVVILVELNKSEQVASKLQLHCSWSM